MYNAGLRLIPVYGRSVTYHCTAMYPHFASNEHTLHGAHTLQCDTNKTVENELEMQDFQTVILNMHDSVGFCWTKCV